MKVDVKVTRSERCFVGVCLRCKLALQTSGKSAAHLRGLTASMHQMCPLGEANYYGLRAEHTIAALLSSRPEDFPPCGRGFQHDPAAFAETPNRKSRRESLARNAWSRRRGPTSSGRPIV